MPEIIAIPLPMYSFPIKVLVSYITKISTSSSHPILETGSWMWLAKYKFCCAGLINQSCQEAKSMAFIHRIPEAEATGDLKKDFDFISGSYSHISQRKVSTPQVYTTNTIVPAYFNFGAVQNRVLTNNGKHDLSQGVLPNILVNFAISFYSACFY